MTFVMNFLFCNFAPLLTFAALENIPYCRRGMDHVAALTLHFCPQARCDSKSIMIWLHFFCFTVTNAS
uniref:Secreted protein n=1 Tax=Lepeophtheirus salmonis TaxID=72036 RepID=A0A0K2SVA4_LEPSM